MDWERLDRSKTALLIDRISLTAEGRIFSLTSSEGQTQPLAFYQGYRLYRLTNFATLPSFSLDFLGDGGQFYLLDGTADPIRLVNDRGCLSLNINNIIDYVAFYFHAVVSDDGDIYLIRDLRELPFLESLSIDQQILLKKRHRQVEVSYEDDAGIFILNADMYFDGTLMRADILVTDMGEITIRNASMLMSDRVAAPVIQDLSRLIVS